MMKTKALLCTVILTLTGFLVGCGDESKPPRVWKAEECNQYHKEAKEAERKGDAKALAELGPLVSQCMRRWDNTKSTGRKW